MNKEEIWKNTRHFKIESNYGKFDLIETDIYLDLLNKYNDLQHQLEEKQKIIDEIDKRCNQEINAAIIQYERNKRNDTWQYIIAHKRILEILERESEE